jgi:trehalose-phosphatase
MKTSSQVGTSRSERQFGPDAFFAQLREARRGVLLLDYDGTLSPLTPDRDQAVPYPGVRDLLEQIARKSRVVIVSGRPVQDVLRLLALRRPIEVWGVHGLERCLLTGEYVAALPDRADAEVLERAAADIEAQDWTQHVERKPGSVAVHWRGLPLPQVERMREWVKDRWTALAEGTGLSLEPFDGGLELRAAARTKGDAVRAVLGETAPGLPVAYLGDDLTDEEAFRALAGRGLRVLVHPEFRETAADLWVRPADQLMAFLERWRNVTEEGA